MTFAAISVNNRYPDCPSLTQTGPSIFPKKSPFNISTLALEETRASSAGSNRSIELPPGVWAFARLSPMATTSDTVIECLIQNLQIRGDLAAFTANCFCQE